MDQLFYDIEGLKVFLDRTLNKFDIFSQRFVEVAVDDILLARGPAQAERFARAKMIDAFSHKVAEEMELDRRVNELGTSFVGKVYIFSGSSLKEMLKAAIISVLQDAAIFERGMEARNQEVGDESEKENQ